MTDDLVHSLSERIARLEERLLSSDKALELARKAMDSKWPNIAAIVSVFIAALALLMQFFKK